MDETIDTSGTAGAAHGPAAGLPFPLGAPPSAEAFEPIAPAELRALVHAGENDSDACERVLAQVARIEGAIDLALGGGLDALTKGDRLIALGFSGLKDYAREVLDLGQRHSQTLAQLSRELESRPRLREAVRAGQVRTRHAQTVLPVAKGDAEVPWTEAAKRMTVRALEAAVKRAPDAVPDDSDGEPWLRFAVRLDDGQRAVVDEALKIAGRLLPGSTRHQRLEVMAMEFLGGHALVAHEVDEQRDDAGQLCAAFDRFDFERRRTDREAHLEHETSWWSYLEAPAAVVVPDLAFDDSSTPGEIDARLREVAALRARWDVLVGYLCRVVQGSGLWKLAGFDSFQHYARERLGLAARTIEQRARLEMLLWKKPALRAAQDAGISYERLRVLSRLPDHEIPGWLERAKGMTVVALRSAVDQRDEAQMRAQSVLRSGVPARVATLLDAAIRTVRAIAKRLVDAGSCLVLVAYHFIMTWKEHVKRSKTRSQQVRERDLGRCQCPGCSRRATHSHHVVPRSQGGSDDLANQVALCTLHHLIGIHGGFLRVSGQAPDGLVWELVRGPCGAVPFTGSVPRSGKEVVAEA